MITLRLISLLLFCSFALATDIVQIDVGTEVAFTGVLNMPKSYKIHPSNHGTHMAKALESQLKIVGSYPVQAKQIVWDYEAKNSRNSLLLSLKEAIDESPLVLSLSLGGNRFDPTEEALIHVNTMNDTVIVAAAGNEGGGTNYFPANYSNACILSVGTSLNGYRAYYSNHGSVWLEYNPMDPQGTSASAARMAGIVLQIRRHNPKMNCADVVLTAKMLYGRIQR